MYFVAVPPGDPDAAGDVVDLDLRVGVDRTALTDLALCSLGARRYREQDEPVKTRMESAPLDQQVGTL